jgi:hypothetical protein
MRIFYFAVTVMVLTLAVATSAAAQSSVEGYEDRGGQIQAQVQGPGGGGGSSPSVATTTTEGGGGGSLPFTGLDVALLLGAGGMLVVAGLAMRRLTRSPGSA